MKKVTAKHFYSFDSNTLIKAFNDPSVIRAKLEDSGAKDISISINESDDGFSTEIKRTMPADVPGVLKSILGEWNAISQLENWTSTEDGNHVCRIQIDIEGVPANITGEIAMTSSGILTTNQIAIEVACGIPLMGGQVEKFVATSIEKSIAQEFEFLKRYLS